MKKILLYFLLMITFFAALSYFSETKAYDFGEWDDDFVYYENVERGKVLMEGQFWDGDILQISVLVKDMSSPILGIAFHLNYAKEKMSFLKYEPGDFLERGGDPYYLVKDDETKSSVIFGETLRRDDKFPLGEGKIANFYFQTSRDKSFDLHFESGVISTLDTVRQDLDQIDWQDLSLNKNDPSSVSTPAMRMNPTSQNSSLLVSSLSPSHKLIISLCIFAILTITAIAILLKKRKTALYKGICQF